MDSLKKDNKSSYGILHSTVAWCNATTHSSCHTWWSLEKCQKMLKVTNQLQFLPTKTSLSAINCVSAQVRINDTCNAFFNLPISYYDSSHRKSSFHIYWHFSCIKYFYATHLAVVLYINKVPTKSRAFNMWNCLHIIVWVRELNVL